MKTIPLFGAACIMCCPLLLFGQNGALPTTRILYKMEKNKTEGLPPAGIKVFKYTSKSIISSPPGYSSTNSLFIYENITNSATIGSEGWRNENMESATGISYLGNANIHGGFLLDAIDPTGVRKLAISWNCKTLLARSASTNFVQMQYDGKVGITTDYTSKYSCSQTPGDEQNSNFTLEFLNDNWYNSLTNIFYPKFQLRWFYCSTGKSSASQSRISLENLILQEVFNATKQEGALTDKAIWSIDLPQKYENFILNHNTTLSSAQSAGEVQIAPGKSLSLTSGAALSVKKLDLFSDDTYGTSEIIRDGGTLSVTDKLTVTKTLPEKGKWYFISFPFEVKASGVKSFDIGDNSTTEAGNHLYIKSYDGEKRAANGSSTGNWIVTPTPTDGSIVIFEKNKGYLIAIDATSDTQEISFEGSSASTFGSNEIISTSCYIHDNNPESVHTGWILTGNPLLNSLQLNGKASLIGVTPFAYYYNQGSHTYDVFNMEESALPFKPFEAFFVKTTESGAMTFTTARNASSNSISEQEKVCITLTLKSNENENQTDKTVFQLTENGRSTFSQSEDAYKLRSIDKEMPQISSNANDIEVAVNTLPLNIDTIIPLSVYCPTEGNYTLSSESVNTLKELRLIDLQTNTSYDLLSEKEISFVASVNDENRFQLQVKGYPQTNTDNSKMKVVYDLSVQNGSLHLADPGKEIRLQITDDQGKNLYEGNTSSDFNLPLKGVTGLLIISIKDEKRTSIYKIITANN